MGVREGLRQGSESGVWILQSDESEALVCELKGLLPAVPRWCVHAASELVAAATGLLAAAIAALLFVLGCLLCCCSCKIPKVWCIVVSMTDMPLSTCSDRNISTNTGSLHTVNLLLHRKERGA